MTREDEKWLATEIVRCAERWPDRVGAGVLCALIPGVGAYVGDRCIMGEIGQVDAYYRFGVVRAERLWREAMSDPRPFSNLCLQAAGLNDKGTPWGQIPKLLGLVPGEADAQDLDSVDGVDRGRISGSVPAVSEPAPDGVALSLVEA